MQFPGIHAEIMFCPKGMEPQLIELIKEYKIKLDEVRRQMETRLTELCKDHTFNPLAVCCPEMRITVMDWDTRHTQISADIYSSVGARGPRGAVQPPQPQVMYV